MRQITLLVSFLSISIIAFAQQYNTADIIKRADSIMVSTVGQEIFLQHFKFEPTSYYEAETAFDTSKIKYLTETKRTHGKLKVIVVRYIFYLKKFEQPSVWTSLMFDKNLNLEKPVDTLFILKKTESDFLTKEKVLEIAKSKFVKQGTKPIETSLTYDYNKNIYVWSIANIINEWKDAYNNIQKQVELLEINAATGKILNYFPNAY